MRRGWRNWACTRWKDRLRGDLIETFKNLYNIIHAYLPGGAHVYLSDKILFSVRHYLKAFKFIRLCIYFIYIALKCQCCCQLLWWIWVPALWWKSSVILVCYTLCVHVHWTKYVHLFSEILCYIWISWNTNFHTVTHTTMHIYIQHAMCLSLVNVERKMEFWYWKKW